MTLSRVLAQPTNLMCTIGTLSGVNGEYVEIDFNSNMGVALRTMLDKHVSVLPVFMKSAGSIKWWLDFRHMTAFILDQCEFGNDTSMTIEALVKLACPDGRQAILDYVHVPRLMPCITIPSGLHFFDVVKLFALGNHHVVVVNPELDCTLRVLSEHDIIAVLANTIQ